MLTLLHEPNFPPYKLLVSTILFLGIIYGMHACLVSHRQLALLCRWLMSLYNYVQLKSATYIHSEHCIIIMHCMQTFCFSERPFARTIIKVVYEPLIIEQLYSSLYTHARRHTTTPVCIPHATEALWSRSSNNTEFKARTYTCAYCHHGHHPNGLCHHNTCPSPRFPYFVAAAL